MPGVCEVCSSEQSKYRCPTCGLMSCSLACTQSHKIYCAPKPESPKPSEVNASDVPQDAVNGHETGDGAVKEHGKFDLKALGSSPELKDLLSRYPQLRGQLRDMYKATLEEEWVEVSHSHRGRGRGFGRGRGAPRSRGPWSREKGFNRGLGKVRKLREQCEEGVETGKSAEGFMRFVALIAGDDENHQGESA